jgi:hypothetical protein
MASTPLAAVAAPKVTSVKVNMVFQSFFLATSTSTTNTNFKAQA